MMIILTFICQHCFFKIINSSGDFTNFEEEKHAQPRLKLTPFEHHECSLVL